MDDGTACPSSPLASAAVLGLAHAVVDLATVATVYVEVGLARLPWETVVLAIVAYDGLAFGLQLPIGLLSDRHRVYRPVMFAGLSLTLAGLCLGVSWPLTACVIAGVGNALFHVGAGALVLVLARGRATEPGLFVAPGALGLTLGIWVGTASLSCRWLVAAAVVLSAAVLARHRIGSTGSEDRPSAPAVGPVALWLSVLALL
ncbi:MAG: hypothetical protein HY815_12665, partial [Candidatus Riflebacteria bacterium]|nr:hypothetical protein [Candidatus Riflebacteria bacterium]